MSTEQIKCVLLADRHHTLSEGIRVLLQHEFQAVVTVSDEASLLESAARMQPNVVVADLALTRGESFGWLRRLLARCPESRVIVLSAYDEPTVKQEAFDAGAAGVVSKFDIAAQLVQAVNEVLAGGRYEVPDSARHTAGNDRRKDPAD
jgi:DNA-binding NarL/FixJ family response regulator